VTIPRRCVYTSVTGGYERLSEQPLARRSGIPFICLSDDPKLTSSTWTVRRFRPPFGADHVRNQRAAKLLPHRVLPDFDVSLYIDNSVLLRVPPERLFETFDLAAGLCLPQHGTHATLLDEFLAVACDGLDDFDRISEQLGHYARVAPKVLERRPYWNAILMRDHRVGKVRAAMELWFAHVLRYSRRDQLSAPFAFARVGLSPTVLPIHNGHSWFHSWPHAAARDHGARCWQQTRVTPLLWRALTAAGVEAGTLAEQNKELRDALAEQEARLRGMFAEREAELQAALTDLAERHAAVVTSTTWRATRPMRTLASRLLGRP
jgi:hypothetical protein